MDVIAPTILPATDIIGTAGYDYGDYSKWFNGTSCATPFAAGITALIKSIHRDWTPAQIRDQLIGESAYLDIPVMKVFLSSILGRLGYKRYFEIGQLPRY